MKYLKKFQTNADYQTFKGGDNWVLPNVSLVTENNKLVYKPKSLISFTVDGVTYQAEEGMTWIEFCGSKYNYHPSYGKHYFTYGVFSNPESQNYVKFATNTCTVTDVDPYDVIINGKTYPYKRATGPIHGGGSN